MTTTRTIRDTFSRLVPIGLQKPLLHVKNEWFGGYSRKTWSQEGEDIILRRYFDSKPVGFYVDVGAHHPKRYSNTWLFYKKGWRGINIDPLPGSMRAFERIRRRDINIEQGVSDAKGELQYFMFDDAAYNSFSRELSESRHTINPNCKVVETKTIGVDTLANLLDQYLPEGQQIDFLTIDVEGLDLQVLRSNDWSRFRPKLVLVEIRKSTLAELHKQPISQFLSLQGYDAFAKTVNTIFFRRDS